MTQAVVTAQNGGADYSGTFRNKIINGDMRIDQRNGGAYSIAAGYTVDRWAWFASQTNKGTWGQNFNAATPPTGFSNYLGFQTGSSGYSVTTNDIFFFYQHIEGYNTSELNFGTSSAKTVTISFWVNSSLTGTFGGTLTNSAYNRSYGFTYTITSPNTWTYISIPIPGDTSGTWIGGTNGIGVTVRFSVGAGSANSITAGSWQSAGASGVTGTVSVLGTATATFYLTGVQLEVGTQATPFERRPYGTELQLCKRYYEYLPALYYRTYIPNSTTVRMYTLWNVTKRANPTVTVYATANGAAGYITAAGANYAIAGAVTNDGISYCWESVSIPSGNANWDIGFNLKADAEL